MSSPQTKSLESLIIKKLNDKKSYNAKVHDSFGYVLKHFTDEDYLHNIGHAQIISLIYLNNFYKFKTVKSLCIHLNLDNKTLLQYRKLYVSLFAKHYLNLSSLSNLDYLRLFSELTKSTASSNKNKK